MVYIGVASISGVYIESTPPTFVVVLYSPNVDPVVVGSGIEVVLKAGVGKENVDGFGGGNTTGVDFNEYVSKAGVSNPEVIPVS